jgi:hypothetical protein
MSNLTIVVTFDNSVSSLQTTDPTLYNEYTTAVNTAVQFYENTITNPITVSINFGWGEIGATAAEPSGFPIDPGADGESDTFQFNTTYNLLHAAVVATDTTSAVQLTAVSTLPLTDPTHGATFSIATAEAVALGLATPREIGGAAFVGGSVGLDSTAAWSWVQTSIAPDTGDAVGTLEHEISEVLGRSATGGIPFGDPSTVTYSLLDMFRYTAANGGQDDAPGAAVGARDEAFAPGYSTTAPASASPGLNSFSYFSFNGTTVTLPFETPADVADGADVGDWDPSVPGDSFADGVNGQADLVTPTDLQVMNVLGYDLACYVEGTRILTTHGERRIETLTAGDHVVTLLGGTGRVIWLGRREMDLTRHPAPSLAWPVRVRAGAFAPGLPSRDLYLSPDHAVYADGVLIPVKLLINGSTVRQVKMDRVVYHHVELEEHDVILAEGLPAETYLDAGHRDTFSGGVVTALYPDFTARRWEMVASAPLALTGPGLDGVRRRLAARADAAPQSRVAMAS